MLPKPSRLSSSVPCSEQIVLKIFHACAAVLSCAARQSQRNVNVSVIKSTSTSASLRQSQGQGQSQGQSQNQRQAA
eukprot:280808-Rhodomonas_salina.1